MGIRSLKLKEAHKSNGAPSFCSLIYDHQCNHLITACGSASEVLVHHLSDPSRSPSVIRGHKSGVTALALSPNSTCLASGSADHSVKIFKFPGGEFQSNITRFTLPIRSLAFNKSGSLLAAAGDDEGIKLIATIDGSISRVLKGHKGPVTGIAFDPVNEYLASVDATGTVFFWELSSGKPINTLKGVAPNFGLDTTCLNTVGWSPDGEMVAVPGLKNDIVMYDRDTAETLFSLRDHEQPVCFLSWSPNGKYIAASDLDRQLLVWDVNQRQDIARKRFDNSISCLAWKPGGNALAVIDTMGNFGVWEPVVPLQMRSPSDGIPSLQARGGNGLLLFDEESDNSGSSGDREGSFVPVPANKKRSLRQSQFSDLSNSESDGEEQLLTRIKLGNKSSSTIRENPDDGNVKNQVKNERPVMQKAFQPGCTPSQPGKRHFLCYNMLGSITSIVNDGYHHIEVDFHDTGRGPRISSMTDHFGFTMASLNEFGSVFANPRMSEKSISTLMYRPFSSWANNSEWSMRFEVEEVKVVALGTGWVAAVTDLNFLRIFSEGGLQLHMLSLDGPVVTAAGFKDELAVVTHASHFLPSGDQILELRVFNISKGNHSIRCPLPLTPGCSLTWFGFSEEGHLSSYDSKGVLRVFSHLYGGSWLPVFSASREKNYEAENYWVVGVNESKLFCVVCKSPDTYPSVVPKPILALLNLSFPLAASDLGPNDLENEFMMSCLHLSQAQKKIEEVAISGQDTTAAEDEAFNLEAALDRCILRLIANCCNGDKLVRATELAQLLSLEKSLRGAIKLVTALKLPILAERFTGILEERLMKTASEHIVSAETNGILPMIVNRSLLQSDVPKSLCTQQQKGVLENNKSMMDKESCKESQENRKSIDCVPVHKPVEEVTLKCNKLEGVTKAVGQEISLGNGLGQIHRPKNPFAKASINQQNPSLLDSIKKMKVNKEIKVSSGRQS